MFFKKIVNKLFLNSLQGNLKYYIINGILFTIMTSFSKSYAMKFLFRIGGNELHISLFNALPGFLAIFATIPGIIWMSKTRDKKRTMGKVFFASRFLTFLTAFVPFFPSSYQPILFVLIVSLTNFPESVSVTALQSYSGDVFFPEERATAISLRNKFSALAQLLSLLIVGKILGLSFFSQKQVIYIYQLFFVLAFITGLIEIRSFYRLKEVSCTSSNSLPKMKELLPKIMKNKRFCIFMACSLCFHFGWQMGWPLFNIYQIKYLGADEDWLTILNITSSVIMFFSYNYWNKMIEKKGNPYVMAVTTLGMAVTPILFAISYNLFILTFMGLITGFFTAGTTTVILSSLLEVSPENERMLYVGIHATLTNITLAISPIIGNLVLESSNIYIALLVTAGFRFIGSLAFFTVGLKNRCVTSSCKQINS